MDRLSRIYQGWSDFQASLLRALIPLRAEHLHWRPAPDRRSLGEVVRHISTGRVTWLCRMGAPGSDAISARVPRWHHDDDGTRRVAEDSIACDDVAVLAEWLKLSWQPIQQMLELWTTDDLFRTYTLAGYTVSHQWTIWRIMSHDLHHGGQIAMMLRMQGFEAFD